MSSIEEKLWDGCLKNKLKKVKSILDGTQKFNINWQDKRDETTPLFVASWSGYVPIVKLLLDAGADVNIPDDYDTTPLIVASEEGHEEIVKLLLDNNADIDHMSRMHKTALMEASCGGFTRIVKLLLDRGADYTKKNKNNKTALDFAILYQKKDVINLFKKEIPEKRLMTVIDAANTGLTNQDNPFANNFENIETLKEFMDSDTAKGRRKSIKKRKKSNRIRKSIKKRRLF